MRAFWIGCTLPFPEPGIRLIRQSQVEFFHDQMLGYRLELDDAVNSLDRHYSELKDAAQRRLGRLYEPSDYPPTLKGLFGLDWDFPSVEPPDYLLELSPEIYEQERSRVASRFEEAINLAEQAFIGKLAKLVPHLTERLTGTDNGERKVFRDSAVQNLTEFFNRFRELNVRSNAQLDDLVVNAQRIVQGIEPQALRDNNALRQHVTTELARVTTALDGMVIDRRRRRIPRTNQENP